MEPKKFFYDFGRALYRVDAVYDEFAKKSGVAPALLWVLYALNDDNAHTQREICADWELPKSTVNTVMTKLKQKGFVEFSPIKGKRREMTVNLTESGKNYADNVLSEIYQREAEVFGKLKKSEVQVTAYLEKITKLLRDKD